MQRLTTCPEKNRRETVPRAWPGTFARMGVTSTAEVVSVSIEPTEPVVLVEFQVLEAGA